MKLAAFGRTSHHSARWWTKVNVTPGTKGAKTKAKAKAKLESVPQVNQPPSPRRTEAAAPARLSAVQGRSHGMEGRTCSRCRCPLAVHEHRLTKENFRHHCLYNYDLLSHFPMNKT